MENVAILKEENKKLQKKLKEASKEETPPTKQSAKQKQISEREITALSVEHEMLAKQVAEMKEFIKTNEQKTTPNMEESMTYATA